MNEKTIALKAEVVSKIGEVIDNSCEIPAG